MSKQKDKDKFGKEYFNSECGYASSILKGRKPIQNRFWMRYIGKYKKNGRLLDIGCGKGFFLQYAEKSYETYGVDISTYGIEQATGRLNDTKLYVGNAEQLDFEDGYFDVVTCFDVLEHLDEPQVCIGECNRVLVHDGLIVASIPNIESLGQRWKKEQWFGYRDQTHVSLLSNEEWNLLLRKNGFRILDIFYDGLWDSPYFKKVPIFLQHLPFKLFFTLLFPLLGILGIKLSSRWGENLIVVADKLSLTI